MDFCISARAVRWSNVDRTEAALVWFFFDRHDTKSCCVSCLSFSRRSRIYHNTTTLTNSNWILSERPLLWSSRNQCWKNVPLKLFGRPCPVNVYSLITLDDGNIACITLCLLSRTRHLILELVMPHFFCSPCMWFWRAFLIFFWISAMGI